MARHKGKAARNMRDITDDDIDRFFKDDTLTPVEQTRMREIREAARNLAKVIRRNTPKSADQTIAIRKVREAADYSKSAIVVFS